MIRLHGRASVRAPDVALAGEVAIGSRRGWPGTTAVLALHFFCDGYNFSEQEVILQKSSLSAPMDPPIHFALLQWED